MSYPFPLGTAEEACDGAMVAAGSWVAKLKSDGIAAAKERFCQEFIKKLEENGMKSGDTYDT